MVFRLFVTAKPNNTSMNHNKLPFVPFIFITSLVLVFLFSCKEKEPSDPNANCTTCHSVLEAKDYFAFKQGSYWVYEEETTHERDSMYVTQSWIGADYDFYVKIKSNLSDFEYTYWPVYNSNSNNCSNQNNLNSNCLFIYRNKSRPLNNLGDTRALFINYAIGSHYGTAEVGSTCFKNNVKVLGIENQYFNGYFDFNYTLKINESCSYHYGQQPVNLYYSKGVGIVRKELIDSNQVWNLVKYKIAL